MTDAFECDRCGELYGEPPELKVATSGLEQSGGEVNLKKKKTRSLNPALGGAAVPETTDSTYEINRGDLCEDCADAFRDFWGESDD